MDCSPSCVFSLPEIGTAKIATNLDFCTTPPELTITVKHEVRSTSTFVCGEPSSSFVSDSRHIGTEHWPLRLNVHFVKQNENSYYAKACIVTERSDTESCFINSTFPPTIAPVCGRIVSTSLPMFLLSIILAAIFFTIAVGTVFVVHRIFIKCFSNSGSNNNYHKQSQQQALLSPGLPTDKLHSSRWDDDRLTVIEEEKEELSAYISPSQSTCFDTEKGQSPHIHRVYRSIDDRVDTMVSSTLKPSVMSSFKKPHDV